MVNTIYWATDDPERPKSYDTGVPLTVGGPVAGDLLMIPGPLGLRWRGCGRLLPRLECGELAGYNRPDSNRARAWLVLAPRIGDNVFVKLFAHGCQERHFDTLLGGSTHTLLDDVCEEVARRRMELCFVSAYQLWGAVGAVREARDPLSVRGNEASLGD